MTYGFGLGRIIFVAIAAAILAYVVLVEIFDSPTVEVQSAWTALGVFGAIITGANAIDSRRDLLALRESRSNGMLRVVAYQAIRQDVLRLLQMFAIVGVGLATMIAAPTLTAAQREQLHLPLWTPLSITTTSALIIIVGIAVMQALLDRRARLTMYRASGMR